jgi:hypothetical protein
MLVLKGPISKYPLLASDLFKGMAIIRAFTVNTLPDHVTDPPPVNAHGADIVE